MKGTLVCQSASIFQLFASENQTLLIRKNLAILATFAILASFAILAILTSHSLNFCAILIKKCQ